MPGRSLIAAVQQAVEKRFIENDSGDFSFNLDRVERAIGSASR